MVAPVSTLARPPNSCHSPLTDACMRHAFTVPTPWQVSPDGQSAAVVHGVFATEQVKGATGVAGWSALFTTMSWIVTRTWVSGVESPCHPANIVAAYPVGITP